MMDKEKLKGIWAGVPVAWKDDDTFDEKTYRNDVARCCEVGIPGIYTGGTTGEFYAQEIEEFMAITDATIAECRNAHVPVMIGCTSTCTRLVIRKAKYAAEKGADAIQVALPFWLEVPDRCVAGFFKEVADAIPGIPISIYNAGARMKKTLTPELLLEIHEKVPSVMHIKGVGDTPEMRRNVCSAINPYYRIFVGEHLLAELGKLGAIGSCSSFVYQNPRILLHMQALLYKKKWDELDVLCNKIGFICKEGLKPIIEAGCEDSAIDRLLGRSAGFLKTSLRCRGPYPYCSEQDLQQFRKWLQSNAPEFLEL
jgi:4-hydroxy-tetrahydrodipicolinate synthase